jgi:hypothetical protein
MKRSLLKAPIGSKSISYLYRPESKKGTVHNSDQEAMSSL